MQDPGKLSIKDYDYDLPPDRIAQFPLPARDESKLLVYRHGEIRDDIFRNIDNYLEKDAILVFNETRVIQARLEFYKKSGARIEIFCLEPFQPAGHIELAFSQHPPVIWKCLIGNLRKWKSGILEMKICIDNGECILRAEKTGEHKGSFTVKFDWEPDYLTFSEILDKAGHVPLPPYIQRKDIPSDKERYQTIYANRDGSVAAPTAGLHFTAGVLDRLERKHIEMARLTLHVSAGTFKPVNTPSVLDHVMHSEKVLIDKELINKLSRQQPGKVIAVGTTSTRTLESLYWVGVKLILGENIDEIFQVHQWDPYEARYQKNISVQDALNAVAGHMEDKSIQRLTGNTQMIIVPGYDYKIVEGLITNFHMPRSTLLMLVAALVGEDWRKVYEHALSHNYRLLSYGDSCLFLPSRFHNS